MPAHNAIDLTGQVFGRLTVLRRCGRDSDGRAIWICKCSCAAQSEKAVGGRELRRGDTKSCGCLMVKNGSTRGGKRIRTAESFHAMHQRCERFTHHKYSQYGARGVKVCGLWSGKDGFVHFLADMGERPEGTTLDRYPNVDGNYEPTNCRWATPKEQANNRRPRLKKAA